MQVLMLGFMNEEALSKTEQEGRVTFFSRSRNKLWTKENIRQLPICKRDTHRLRQ